MNTLDHALMYARRGWHVFQLPPKSKKPVKGSGGFYDATTNPETLRRWFGCDLQYNIGIRAGLASRVLILDIDGEIGQANFLKLIGEHGALPRTLTARTSRGRHLWFSITSPVPSSHGEIAQNLDIQSDGTYVLAPPSIHPDGTIYRWISDLPPAPAPAWLIRLAHQCKKPTPVALPAPRMVAAPIKITSGSSDAYGKAALADEIKALSQAPKGTRNAALNLASFKLHQLVAGGELADDVVKHSLLDAANANGLMTDPDDGPNSVLRTINSGAAGGMSNPRDRNGRR